MIFLRNALTAAADGQTASGGLLGNLFPILMLVAVLAIFFFTSRSQKKQEKQIQDMRDGLQVGDEITTIGGIIGKIVSIKDETVIIETGRDHVTMRILKTAVKNVDVPAQASYSESNKHND